MCRTQGQEDVFLATWEAEAEELLEDYGEAWEHSAIEFTKSTGTKVQSADYRHQEVETQAPGPHCGPSASEAAKFPGDYSTSQRPR